MQKGEKLKSDSHETKPVRVSKTYYEWIRKEAFEKNDTIRNITDKILYEFIQDKEQEIHT